MRFQDVIRRKRDGARLSDDEISFAIEALSRGLVPDYQVTALVMAAFIRGLDAAELRAWTDAMVHSGDVMDLTSVPGVKVDKHSTGGVGDKVSLMLAPLVASLGVPVPMISGRGLGHTGGTLDKLESIPGFNVRLSTDRFLQALADVGVAMIGQTDRLAPADRKLYALRDATSTIESIPLIASSIMSKKIAEGIDALVLDVKVGSGAFMKTADRARELAATMADIGASLGKRVVAYLTDMSVPLGNEAGNAREVIESVEVLRGEGPADLRALVIELSAEMLVLGHRAANIEEGKALCARALSDGSALRKFADMVAFQGGDARVAGDFSILPCARERVEVKAQSSGQVLSMDVEALGVAVLVLGAGRETVEQQIDYGVGATFHKKTGDAVRAGEPLVTLHVNDRRRLDESLSLIHKAYRIGDGLAERSPLILDRIVGKACQGE